MAYHKIGIFGATGKLGQELTRALKDDGFHVVPFSRKQTTVAGIPTQSLGSLVGFDVVVSAVGQGGLEAQAAVIQQAKADGVKRFIPSEFGCDHRTVPGEFFDTKRKIATAVQSAKFPDGWMSVSSGFYDIWIPFMVKKDIELSTITVGGTGKKRYPFVSRYDLGRVLGVTFRQPSKYKDQWIFVASNWLSLDEIAAQIQIQSHSPLAINHLDITEKQPAMYQLERDESLNVFDPSQQTIFPIQLSDVKEFIKNL